MRKSRLNGYMDWCLSRGIDDKDIKWLVERKTPRKGAFLMLVKGDLTNPLTLLLWTAGLSLVLGSTYRLVWLACDVSSHLLFLLLGVWMLSVMIRAFTTMFNILKYGIVHYFIVDEKDIENSRQKHGNFLCIIPSKSDLKDFPDQAIIVENDLVRELRYTYQYTRIEILVAVCFKRGVVVDSMPFAYRGVE